MADFDLNQDELMATFVDEAAEQIAALETGLLALETSPGDGEVIREMLRHAHTLKGNASCVGLQEITSFAHAYEEMLQQLDRETVSPALLTLMLSGIDTFRRLMPATQNVLASAGSSRSLRVSCDRLNRMLDLSGEISIARGRVQQLATTGEVSSLIEAEAAIDFLHNELQELIMRTRMVPIGPLFRQYARTVRDLASSLGKEVHLVTKGDDVEIDTNAVEMLRDPLTHMIRNAIDHGLEAAEQRIATGKSSTGTITLEALHEAGTIIIRVSDDGAGLDRRGIAAHAMRIGIDASRMSEAEIDRLIFDDGFSTSDGVTDLSGRGVGMAVVRRSIESLRGTIRIESRTGEGTTFVVRLPLTLAVIEGFGVSAADETYVVPMTNVLECIEMPTSEPRERTTGILLLRDEVVPYIRLGALFGASEESPVRENALIVQHDGMKAALVVDSLHGASQAVIKPLGDYFEDVPGIAGSSILGSGRVALILDIRAIFDRMEKEHATE